VPTEPNSSPFDGIDPGIAGLSEVLCGGFLKTRGSRGQLEPPLVLVKGPAGSGKTSLAIHIAAQQCQDANCVIFFTLDQPPNKIEHHVRSFACLRELSIGIDDRWLLKSKASQWPDKPPMLLISDFPLFRLEAQQMQQTFVRWILAAVLRPDFFSKFYHHIFDRIEALNDHLRGWEEQFHPRGGGEARVSAVVIDGLIAPLEANELGFKPQKVQRALLAALGDQLRSLGILPIVLAEEGPATLWHDYVADVVIEMSNPGMIDKEPLRRLQVVKARCQPILAGSHVVRISSEQGVIVYPSPGEIVRFRTDKRSLETSEAPEDWCDEQDDQGRVRFEGFNNFMQKTRRGSATLLYGEDQTKKNVLGAAFVAKVCSDVASHDDTASGDHTVTSALYIYGGSVRQKAYDVLELYASHVASQVWDASSGGAFDEVNPPAIVAIEAPRRYETVNEFFRRVIDSVDRNARAGRPISRALICDLASMAFAEDTIQLLREYFSRSGISSLFIYTTTERSPEELREYFDNVIHSERLTLPGAYQRAIGYQVRKRGGSSAPSDDYWRLDILPLEDGDEASVAASQAGGTSTDIEPQEASRYRLSQEGFADLRLSTDKTLTYFPVKLALYAPDKKAKKFWKEQASAEFGVLEGSSFFANYDPQISLFTRDQAESLFEGLVNLPTQPHLESTQVVNCDSYWSRALVNKLERLSDVFEKLGENPRPRLLSQIDATALEKTNQDFVIPHHINFGIYTARVDKLAHFAPPESREHLMSKWGPDAEETLDASVFDRRKREWERFLNDHETTWGDLEIIAEHCVKKSDDRPRFSACWHGRDESLICFLLEVVWEALFADYRDRFEKFDDAEPVEDVAFASKDVVEACARLFEHLVAMKAMPLDRMLDGDAAREASPEKAKDGDEFASQVAGDDAIFQRHWLVTYWQSVERIKRFNGDLRPINHPTLEFATETEEGEKVVRLKTQSICGDWSLGIVKGSPNPQRGAWVIESLTGPIAQSQLQSHGIGASVLKQFSDTGALAHLGKVYRKSKLRSAIAGYHRTRVFLADRVRSIFCSEELVREYLDDKAKGSVTIRHTIRRRLESLR
jgi:hypothetical protein